eukprot:3332085-Karenia_brevis.AAC.1
MISTSIPQCAGRGPMLSTGHHQTPLLTDQSHRRRPILYHHCNPLGKSQNWNTGKRGMKG